jgi:hypothetical protein
MEKHLSKINLLLDAQECKKFVFAVKRLRDEYKNTGFALLLSQKFLAL